MKRIWLGVLSFCLFAITLAQAQELPFLLVLSREIKPYLDFAEGFKKHHPKARLIILPEDLPLLGPLLSQRPFAVVAVGTKALKSIKKFPHHPQTRFFYALVVTPESVQKIFPKARCGLYLRLPPEKTFPLIKDFFGKLKRPALQTGGPFLKIFIPYVAEENQDFVQRAREMGKQLGFLVVDQKIRDLPSLEKELLEKDFDLLYAIPDPLYATEESISFIIKTCLWRKKGVCGYNRFFYRRGALISFVFDYQKVGEFAGKYFLRRECQSVPAPFQMLINEKTLKLLLEGNYHQPPPLSGKVGCGRRLSKLQRPLPPPAPPERRGDPPDPSPLRGWGVGGLGRKKN